MAKGPRRRHSVLLSICSDMGEAEVGEVGWGVDVGAVVGVIVTDITVPVAVPAALAGGGLTSTSTWGKVSNGCGSKVSSPSVSVLVLVSSWSSVSTRGSTK